MVNVPWSLASDIAGKRAKPGFVPPRMASSRLATSTSAGRSTMVSTPTKLKQLNRVLHVGAAHQGDGRRRMRGREELRRISWVIA